RYRVQLNLMRIHNPTSHNMRSFEIPAVGGIGLFPDTIDHRAYFSIGEELFLYKNENECVQTAEKLLVLSRIAADEIRKRARQRSYDAGYSYAARSADVLDMLKKLIV
ncbi:MAG: glycosyltransferase, partial [Bacteroidota bacterium]